MMKNGVQIENIFFTPHSEMTPFDDNFETSSFLGKKPSSLRPFAGRHRFAALSPLEILRQLMAEWHLLQRARVSTLAELSL